MRRILPIESWNFFVLYLLEQYFFFLSIIKHLIFRPKILHNDNDDLCRIENAWHFFLSMQLVTMLCKVFHFPKSIFNLKKYQVCNSMCMISILYWQNNSINLNVIKETSMKLILLGLNLWILPAKLKWGISISISPKFLKYTCSNSKKL